MNYLRLIFMMRFFLTTVLLISFFASFSQIPVSFEPVFKGERLKEGKYYRLNSGDSVVIRNFRWYMSAICLWKGDSLVYKEVESFHLVNMSDAESLHFLLYANKDLDYDRISFSLGIDSTTSVSGAFGGDLDPAKGMFWTWQSGYINFKLEGESNLVKETDREFFYHLGGYSLPNNTCRSIVLKTGKVKNVNIQFSVSDFLDRADLSKTNSIMIPGKDAVRLTDIAKEMFTIKK